MAQGLGKGAGLGVETGEWERVEGSVDRINAWHVPVQESQCIH